MNLESSDESLVARLLPEERVRHGVPAPETVTRHETALAVAQGVLADFLLEEGVRVSPLGPGWSRDIDLHLAVQPPPHMLLDSGWLPLDGLLHDLGSKGRDRWAIAGDGGMLAQADLTTSPPPDPVTAVRRRATRRGEVCVREVLELRMLQRRGWDLRADDPVIKAAATLEATLGGDELRQFALGSPTPPRPAPVSLPGGTTASLRRKVGTLRRVTRRRIVVGVSGVDGSGKSSLTRRLADDLIAVGVPASVVWTRPGMRLKALAASARLAHRVLGLGPAPGVRIVASGVADLPVRRGAMGWVWAVAVSVAFAADVRRRHTRAHGVVLYDRHLLDALVTIDFVYAGADLRLARWILRRAVPRALLYLYVDVPPELALARKPGDTFGEYAIRRQLALYASGRHELPGLVVLDGRRCIDELATEALTHLTRRNRTGTTSSTP